MQSIANPAPHLQTAQGPRKSKDADWKPMHPFLRGVSALLSVVLAFTFGGPVQQAWGQTTLTAGSIFVSADDSVVEINASSGTIALSSGTYVAAAKRSLFSLRIAPDPAISDLAVTTMTLSSGTRDAVLGGLSFLDPVFSAAVAKKGVNDPDPISSFEGAMVTVDPLQIGTLTLGNSGLSVPYGIKLSFNKLDSLGSPLAGVKILLGGTSATQTWTIGDVNSASPSSVAGYYEDEASTAVRVENAGTSVKTLKIATYTKDVTAGAPLSSAFLDVGPNINLSKSINQGVLHLKRENASSSLFSGTIDISGGEVDLADGFLQLSGGKGSTVSFTVASYDSAGDPVFLSNPFPTLRINGTNVVSSIVEKLDSATNPNDPTQNYVPTIVGPKSGSTAGGTLVLELGSTDLTLASEVRDDDSSAPLSLVKRGTSTFTPLNNANSFSGGLRVEAGTVAIRFSGDQDSMGQPVGVVGAGQLVLSGSTAGATLQIGSEDVQAVNLLNEVTFKGSSDLSKTSKATILGYAAGDSLTLAGNVLFEGDEANDPTRIELNLLSPLTLTNTVSVAGTLTLTGGNTLTLTPEMSSVILGDFVLQNGTLSIGANATEAGIAVNGSIGSRRIVLTGTGAVIAAGTSTVLPVWESNFSFSGAGKTLEILPLANAAVAIRNTVTMTLEDGTLALGTVQRAAGASSAVLNKSGAGTLEFKGGLVSTGTLALTSLELMGGPVLFSSASPIAFAAPVKLSGSTLQISSGGSLSISGTVSGTGFTKSGAGVLAFTGANTLSGATTLRSGPLSLAAGTGAVFVGDAQTGVADAPTLYTTGSVASALTVGSGATTAYTATLASSGTSGTATFSGPIVLSAGSASLVLQAATGGTLDLTGAWTANSKPITIGASGKAGTVKLSNALGLSTTGGLSVVSGSLQVGVANAIGATTPVNLNGGALNVAALNTTAGTVTLTSGNIYGSGSLSAASVIAQSGSIFANLAGSGTFLKETSGSVTLQGKSLFSGATTVSAGTLTAGLPSSNSTVSIASGATYKLTLTESGTYNGTLTNNGTTLLTSASPVVLTLGTGARLNGSIQIGSNVTLMPATGAQDGLFATGFTLTLDGGSYNANGTTQTISNITFLSNGGSLLSTGTIKTNTVPTTSAGNKIFVSGSLTFPVSRKTNQAEGAALVNPLEFYAGALGDLASGGSYNQIVVLSEKDGATLTFDRLVTAGTSVSAQLAAGSVGYTLSVGSQVVTPLFDIQKGVTAVFTSGGSLWGGTFTATPVLQIGGTVDLSSTSKAFSTIRLNNGLLTNGTLTGGTLEDLGTGSSALAATLGAGFGNLSKTGSGTLTLSGANTSYGGSLSVTGGTVVLGSASALGTTARIASLGAGTVLRLAGNSVKVAALSGTGSIENASSTAATLTLETTSDALFGGVLRNGSGSGALALVKSGATTVTLTAASEYTGGTTVKQGRLELSGSGALPTATALTIEGGTLALGGNTQTVASYTQTGGLVESGTLTLQSGSFALTGGSVSAVLAGAVGATVAGNVTLNSAATYTGATFLTAGKLELGTGGALSNATALNLTGGTFAMGGKSQTVSAYTQRGGLLENGTVLLNAGSFALSGGSVSAVLGGSAGALVTGDVTLNGSATYTGTTALIAGKLQLASAGGLSSQTALSVQGGTLALGGKDQTVASYTQTGGSVESGTLTLQTGSFLLNGGSVSATLAGAAGATVAGNVTLQSAATYTGATVLNSGKLQLASAGALSNLTALTVAGGTLALGGKTQTVSSYTQTGGSVESGMLTLQTGSFGLNGGSVSATLAGSAGAAVAGNVTLNSAATYTGATTLNSGNLQLAGSGALPSSTALTLQDGTLALGGKTQTVGAVVVNGGRIESGTLSGTGYTLNGGTVSASLAGTGAVSVTGNATLSGANTYTGATSLTSTGQLTVGASNALAQSVLQFNNGAVLFANTVTSATFGGLTGSKDLALTNAANAAVALTVAGAADATYAGTLSGTGSFIKAGAGNLTLEKTPTYTGPTTVSAGSLTLGTADLLSGSRTINNDGTINLKLSTGLTYAGTLSGTGTINLSSDTPVTLTLAPNAKLSGTIVLSNVILDLSAANDRLASGTTLRIGTGASVQLGTTTQEIASLVFKGGTLGGSAGAKVLYSSLDPSDLLNTAGTNPKDATYAATAIAFEVLSKTAPILTNGTQTGLLVTAGRAGTEANGRQLLRLQPESNTTRVIIDKPLVLSTGIEAILGTGMTKGMVLIENSLTLTTGSIQFAAGIEATLTQAGSLNASALDNSGLLIVDVSGSKTVQIPIRGSGSFKKIGVGDATLTGTNSYTGGTTLADGVLEIGNASAIGTSGAISFAGGTLRYGSGVNTDLSPRIATLASGTAAGIDTGANTVTFATGLSGAGGIAKLGAGTLVLTGANAFTGSSSVKAGTLQVGAGGTVGSLAAAAAIESGAYLRFLRSNDLTYSGALSGAGTVEQAGSGFLKLDGSNAGFAGVLVLSNGSVGLGSDTASGSASIGFKGGTLRYESGVTTDVSSRIATLASGKTANIDTGGNVVRFASGLTGAGGLVKVGGGTLELQANNTFTGPTTVLSGLLRAGTALTSTSAIRVSGGSLEVSSYKSAAELTVDANGTAIFPVDLGTFEFGKIVNTGRLSFTGGTSEIVIADLSGSGEASFAADATLPGGISGGKLTVAGDLVTPTVSGGVLSAARLYQVSGSGTTGVHVSGGQITVDGTVPSELGTVSGGSLLLLGPVKLAALTGGSLEARHAAELALVSGGTARLSGSSVTIGTVSGGALFLENGLPSIGVLNGGNIANEAVLSVSSGTTNGTISGAGSLTKIGALDLSLLGLTSYTGTTRVMGGTLFVGGLATLSSSEELYVDDAAQARFTATTGTITLKGLTGGGVSVFAGNALIQGGSISEGVLQVAGRLTANIEGGSVAAATLTAGTVSGGAISLTNGASSVTRLTDGSINLASAASLAVSTGNFAGTFTGSGTLVKTGTAGLDLTLTPPSEIAVNVQGGILNVGNLLTGTRSVTVAANAQLNTTTTTATFSGRLSGAGNTALTGTGVLTLGATGFLQGGVSLSAGLTLDLSLAGNTGVDPATSLKLLGNSQLTLGSAQQLELQDLVLSPTSLLSSNNSVILYDSVPVVDLGNNVQAPIISQDNSIIAGSLISGSLRFEENSKKGSLFGGGTYQFIAGRVKDLPTETGAVQRLLLDPLSGKTVRISSGIPAVSQEIVATGTGAGGFVTVGTAVAAPKFVVGTGIQATFTEAGSLAANGVFVNNGTLKFSVLSGSKTVANLISGSGVLEKIDAGMLVLSGANTYSGATRLSAGVLQVNQSAALGTGSIVFNGGGLKYGAGVSTDFSNRFAAIGSGISAALDTGTNNITFGSALSGEGGLSKSGNGTLWLAAANSFAGGLDVMAGTVKVGNGTVGSLAAASANVSSGALLSFNRNDAVTFAGNLTGAGRVEQAGSGQLTLTGDGSAFTGTFELRSGTTLIGDTDALSSGAIAFSGGTLKYGVTGAADLSARISALTTTALVDTGAFNVAYASGLSGTAGLTKYGVGSLTFAGQNTYTGTTTVTAGTLQFTGAGLASTGKIQTLANTVVQLASDEATELPFNGLVSGAARLQKIGSGTITIAGTQTNTGGVILSAGSLVLKNAATLGGVVTLNTGSTLDLVYGSLNPNATLTFRGGALRISEGGLVVNGLDFGSGLGSGEIVFAGTADTTIYYTQKTGSEGNVTVPEAVTLLQYARNADGSPASLSGALKGTITTLPSTSDLTVTPSGKRLTLAVDGLSLTSFTGEAGVDLAITKPVNLSGDFKLKGGTLVLAGSLKSTSGSVVLGAVTSSGTTAVTGTIGSGGSIEARELTLTGKSVLRVENLAGIKGVQTLQVGALSTGVSDAVRKTDAVLDLAGGTLVLAPGQTLKGSGSIQGDVTLGSNAVLSPGNSPGTLYFAGTLNLTSGTIRVEVGGLSAGTLIQDRISVTGGSVIIGGTAGERPTFQIVDTDGILSSGTTLSSLIVDGTGASISPTILTAGTFIFARQSASGAVLPSVMYTLINTGTQSTWINSLQIQRLRFASFAGSAQNVAGFASALDTRILTQKAATDGLLELGTGISSTAELPAQLAAAMPVVYAEMAALSTQRTLNIHQGLLGHFSSLRTNLRETPEGLFNAWTTGYGASHKQDGNRSIGTAGFSASTWGDLFGVEQRIGGFLLGVTGAAGRTSANFANNPGSATTDSWHGGLYGVMDLESLLVESGVLFGSTDTRARRIISAPGLTTREGRVSLNGTEWVANLGLSKPIATSEVLTLIPSLRVIAQGYSQSAAKESDLSGLEVSLAKQNATSFLHQAGVELRRRLSVSGRPAAASLQLDWIHNYSAKGRNLDMALSGNPAASYGYRGSDAGADSLQVGAAFEAALSERTSLRLGGEYQSQKNLSTVRGSVSIGYQF